MYMDQQDVPYNNADGFYNQQVAYPSNVTVNGEVGMSQSTHMSDMREVSTVPTTQRPHIVVMETRKRKTGNLLPTNGARRHNTGPLYASTGSVSSVSVTKRDTLV